MDIEKYIDELIEIDWLGSCGKKAQEYLVLDSLFDAYDNWNGKMQEVWEPIISEIEVDATDLFGDEEIDMVFETVNIRMRDLIYCNWTNFMQTHIDEMGLDNEFIDMIIRDLSWAFLERKVKKESFFKEILNVYRKGYLPVSWDGRYPDGRFVVL